MHIRTHISTYTHIHTYTHAYTHTHIHTRTHMHTYRDTQSTQSSQLSCSHKNSNAPARSAQIHATTPRSSRSSSSNNRMHSSSSHLGGRSQHGTCRRSHRLTNGANLCQPLDTWHVVLLKPTMLYQHLLQVHRVVGPSLREAGAGGWGGICGMGELGVGVVGWRRRGRVRSDSGRWRRRGKSLNDRCVLFTVCMCTCIRVRVHVHVHHRQAKNEYTWRCAWAYI